MSEWLKEHAWKACVGETLPWVRIPLSPPAFARALRELRLGCASRNQVTRVANPRRLSRRSTRKRAKSDLLMECDVEPSRAAQNLRTSREALTEPFENHRDFCSDRFVRYRTHASRQTIRIRPPQQPKSSQALCGTNLGRCHENRMAQCGAKHTHRTTPTVAPDCHDRVQDR